MLYKFKSKETADLIMLAPHAHQILSIIGKDQGLEGILLADEIKAAIFKLQTFMQAQDAAQVDLSKHPISGANSTANHRFDDADDEVNHPQNQVSLKQRVAPFLEMLMRAQIAHVDVVWGV